jgi:hypothetical protein
LNIVAISSKNKERNDSQSNKIEETPSNTSKKRKRVEETSMLANNKPLSSYLLIFQVPKRRKSRLEGKSITGFEGPINKAKYCQKCKKEITDANPIEVIFIYAEETTRIFS